MINDIFVKRAILLVMVGVLLIFAFLMLKPVFIALILGLILAYMLHPVYKWILKYLKYKDLSVAILLIFIILIIAIPVWFLTPMIITQTFETYAYTQKIDFAEPLRQLFPSLFTPALADTIAANINNVVSQAFSSFLNQFAQIFSNLTEILLHFAIFIFALYFGLRDGEILKDYVLKLSPFSPATEKKFVTEFKGITNSVVYGQFVVGLVQGLLLGAGLFILGVPKALTLTVIAIMASVIPVLGAWLVWVPTAAYLLISGNIFAGVVLAIYGAVFISTIDNVLRSIILAKSSHLPVSLALIGTIGGLFYFGLSGLILGPLILAYILILLDFYKEGKLGEIFKKEE